LGPHLGIAGDSDENYKAHSAWNIKTKKVLDQLKDCVTGILKEWDRFRTLDGDINYFAADVRADNSLSAICKEFVELSIHHGKLVRLEKLCKKFGKDVSWNSIYTKVQFNALINIA
jgi:hypothetical protein